MGMLGTCFAIVGSVIEPTATLANMCLASNSVLPESWRKEPIIARKVTTLLAHLEVGLLNTINADLTMSGFGFSVVAESIRTNQDKIRALTRLITKLQEK
jgi:hypothetical protein